jgi:hypothetical protein
VKENEQHPREVWGTIKGADICLMREPEERKEMKEKKIF